MRIAVLGTGVVGRTIGSRLVELGHEVAMGSRTADNPAAVAWSARAGPAASNGAFAEAAASGELVFNCTSGIGSIEALRAAGEANLFGKVLVDVSNPLDFSSGFPPTLAVCNDDSLGEQIQREFPGTSVVKALNTMNCSVMVHPETVPGDHAVFLCGDDAEAKGVVAGLLATFGWKRDSFVDLGDIGGARGVEMILPLWLRLMGTIGSPRFNFAIAR